MARAIRGHGFLVTDLIPAVGNEASRRSRLKSNSQLRAVVVMGGWDVCLAPSHWCPPCRYATLHDSPEGTNYCLYLVVALNVSRDDTSRAPKGDFWRLTVTPVRASHRHVHIRNSPLRLHSNWQLFPVRDNSEMPLLQLFKPAVVPRSQVAHSNPILYDGGRAVNEFFAPGTEYFGRQVIPPDNKWSDGERSFMGMLLPCFT